jgi:Flp pilus assembly protein TadG
MEASHPHCLVWPRSGLFRRFLRNRDGVTAIEFGAVAFPFFAIMFAIFETMIVFFAGQLLESAVSDASRLIMTGQAKNLSAEQFKTEICNRMVDLFGCEDNLSVDVRTYADFAGTSVPPADVGSYGFAPGSGGDIVVVRARYEWPIITSLMGLSLADLPNGKRLILATSAFRNEPFDD